MNHTGDIYRRTEECQGLFTYCLAQPLFSSLVWLENRQGEFNLWAASLQAAHVGKSSLDYRVRDSPEVSQLICDLLDGLSETLECLLEKANPKSTETAQSPESEEDADSMFSDISINENDASSSLSTDMNSAPFHEQMFNIKTIIGQLARLSTAIRQSGTKYRHRKADESLQEADFNDFREHMAAIILIGSMEPNTREKTDVVAIQARITDSGQLTVVQKRLIHANVVRRNRIKFVMRSMDTHQTPVAPQYEKQPARLILPATTEATPKMPQRPTQSMSKESTLPPPVPAPSINRTATNIGSQFKLEPFIEPRKPTNSLVTRVTKTGAGLDYPSCPKPTSNELLQCPYCADILPLAYSKSRSRWMGHVAQDILPYICIYENCETPDMMYLTVDEISKHMCSQHGIIYLICDHCSSRPDTDQLFVFDSQDNWEIHMNESHSGTFTASQIPSLAKLSERRLIEPLSCPFCGYIAETPRETLDDHIAKGLHRFALRCLPWGTGYEEASVDVKSITSSNSSLVTEDNEYGESVLGVSDTMEMYDVLDGKIRRLLELRDLYPKSWTQLLERLQVMQAQFHNHFQHVKPLLQHQTDHLIRQQSHPIILSSWADLDGHSSPEKNGRMIGALRGYIADSSPILSAPENTISEIIVSHLLKITYILHQATTGWKDNHDFDEYTRHFRRSAAQARLALDDELEAINAALSGNPRDISPLSSHQTSLMYACMIGDEKAVKSLLDNSEVDLNSKDGCDRSALSWAVENGHEGIVRLLIATERVDVNSKDDELWTPIFFAILKSHERIVQLLLETSKVNLTVQDKWGWAPLPLAAKHGNEVIVKLLLNAETAYIDLKGREDWTPLSIAAMNGNEAVVKLLLDSGMVNPHSKDVYGQTPISFAAANGHEGIVKALLADNPAGATSIDNWGFAPLSWAAAGGHKDIVESLRYVNPVESADKESIDDVYSDGEQVDIESSDGRSPVEEYSSENNELLGPTTREANAKFYDGTDGGGDKQVADPRVFGVPTSTRLNHVDVLTKVMNFVEDNPVLWRIFERDEDFIRRIVQNAMVLSEKEPDLVNESYLAKLVEISLHLHVLYCDDSSLMKNQDHWECQTKIIQKLVNIITRIGEGGVSLRFVNHEVDNFFDLRPEIIARTMPCVLPDGQTKIGTHLKSRILEPLVYDSIGTWAFREPLLITIITDSVPDHEDQSLLANNIFECSQKLQEANYPPESVRFMIGRIGTNVETASFLEALGNDPRISSVIFIIPENLDQVLEDFNDQEIDQWVTETLLLALMSRDGIRNLVSWCRDS